MPALCERKAEAHKYLCVFSEFRIRVNGPSAAKRFLSRPSGVEEGWRIGVGGDVVGSRCFWESVQSVVSLTDSVRGRALQL